VRGVEFDGTAKLTEELSLYGSGAFTDGRYVSFSDAPPPLEETGGPQA
jgi:iron complex outermembrane receptor protein